MPSTRGNAYRRSKMAARIFSLLGMGSAILGCNAAPRSGTIENLNTFASRSNNAKEASAPHTRTFFYVGGQYIDDGKDGHLYQNQMYVEKLVPAKGPTKKAPILLMHGNGQTGTNWLNKPDGGEGWASLFLRDGYEVYIFDQTSRGRSPWLPGAEVGEPAAITAEYYQQKFTAPQDYLIWPQAVNHTRWPGTGKMGDPVFDNFYQAGYPSLKNNTWQQMSIQAAGAELLDKIGKPTILLGHSQAGPYPILLADIRPNLTHSLVLLEPTGPPFQEAVFSNTSARPYGLTEIPITYSPAVTNPDVDLVRQTIPAASQNLSSCIIQADSPKPRELVNIAPKPILVMTTEASYHSVYDYCTVMYLKQAGCAKLDYYALPKMGIHGNAHMLFMENNSNELHRLVSDWLDKN